MANHAGKEGHVAIGANQIAEIRSWSLSIEGKTVDSTSIDNTDNWESHQHTTKAWSGKVDCFWDESDTNGQVAIDVGDSVTLNLYPEGDDTGDNFYTGTATVTSIDVNSSHDGMVEASFSFQGNGTLTRGDVPA